MTWNWKTWSPLPHNCDYNNQFQDWIGLTSDHTKYNMTLDIIGPSQTSRPAKSDHLCAATLAIADKLMFMKCTNIL